jgi:valacyclovir hydrolase
LNGLNRDRFTLIAWDAPGFGYSRPHSRDFSGSYERDAELAAKLMMQLGINRYSILGWSFGGVTGLMMAANHPLHVQSLVAWGAIAYNTDKNNRFVQKMRDTSKWNQDVRQQFEEIYGEEGLKKLWSDLADTYHEYKDICSDKLPLIKCPVFILHGIKDPITVGEHPLFLKKNISNSRLYCFPEGKHNIHLKFSSEFNEVVTKFLLGTESS